MSHKNYYITGLTALVVSAAIAFAPSSSAALTAYSQDFEEMTPLQGWPPNDLSDDGWKIFGLAWDADPYLGPANVVYGYGPYPAANGEPGSIQSVATREGGADQGKVVLAKYSDYNNIDQLTYYISASTFQTQTIAAGDLGLWRFTYDARIGNLEADSSAYAYILTLDSTIGFGKVFVHNDSTNLPDTWGTYSLDLLIDSTMVGDILQFGFSATSTNYNGSAVFYDNLSFFKVFNLVTIDIKPDSQINNVNPGSKGVIAVSVLTSEDFDALQVDVDTVQFGPAGTAKAHSQAHVKDVDYDGDMDLLFHFRTQETGIQCGDTEATLTGNTWGGIQISGTDSVNTVGCK